MLESASRCPFCDHAIVNHRAPLGGFLGVVLGVALVGCGADDGEESTSMGSTQTMSTTDDTDGTSGNPSTTMTTEDSATGSETLTTSASEATGPLYGPVTEASESESESVTDTDATSTGSDTEDTDGSTGGSTDSSGSGDTTAAESESVGPLYGPVTNGG